MAEENNENNKDMFAVDEALGTIMGAKGPNLLDTKNIDEAIGQIEKPLSGSVYDQLAAMYRSKGEGAVLRAQKNMQSLFLPTINLIKEREADAKARYALLKDQLEEFDDSTIFGQADGTEMPIVDEIRNLANTTKEYMRELSRLNPADDRYDELRKKIKKNNDAIAKFDDINKKLLEIRNSQDGSRDESFWSTSMSETERDMWMDIYNGRGANIKIQNGELVWTDTSGKTKYNFSDISDKGSKRDALGGYDTDLGMLHFQTMDGNKQRDRKSLEKASDDDTKEIQTALNNLGFTDDDGNKLKVDGDFGDKTEEAYKKYLAKKDELEQAYFDENLSEDDIKKYNITTELTGVGETRTIELSKISSGPTLLANDATNAEIIIQGKISELISQGATTESPIYQRAIKSMIFQLGQLGPAGIKSLIFDGIGADDDDIFTSINTDSFIQSIISNQKNAEVFNIKDVDNITPQELLNAIEKLKSNDITFSYFNQNDEKKSLRKLFLEWYKGQADARVDAGARTNIINNRKNPPAPKNPPNNNKTSPSSIELSDDLLEGKGRDKFIGNVNITQTLENLNMDNFYKVFMLEEEPALEILKELLPKGFKLEEKGADLLGIDNIRITDDNGNVLGNYGFDYGSESNAKAQMDRMLRDLQKIQVDLRDIIKPASSTKTDDVKEETVVKPATVKNNTKIYYRDDKKEELPGIQAIRPKKFLEALSAIDIKSYEDIVSLTQDKNKEAVKKLISELKKPKYKVNIDSDLIYTYLAQLIKQIK